MLAYTVLQMKLYWIGITRRKTKSAISCMATNKMITSSFYFNIATLKWAISPVICQKLVDFK